MARVMTSKEIEAEFGIPAEQLGQWADDAERGVYHGEPRGEVVRGRPLLFGEETRQVVAEACGVSGSWEWGAGGEFRIA